MTKEQLAINQLKVDVQGFKLDVDSGMDQEYLDKEAKRILAKAKDYGLQDVVFEEMFGKDLGLMRKEEEYRQEQLVN